MADHKIGAAQIRKIISRIALLEPLTSKEKHKLEEALQEREFQDNEYIIRQAEEGHEFFIILEGSAEARKATPIADTSPGKEKINNGYKLEILNYVPGDYFGELSLLTNAPRAASVVARGYCRVGVIDRAHFEAILGPVKDVMRRNASHRYGVQRQLERQVSRHRQFIVPTKHHTPPAHAHSIARVSTAPAGSMGGFAGSAMGSPVVVSAPTSQPAPPTFSPPPPPSSKTITLCLCDTNGFEAQSKLLLCCQEDLDCLLIRNEAAALAVANEGGTPVSRERVRKFEQIEPGRTYCLLFAASMTSPASGPMTPPESWSGVGQQHSPPGAMSALNC